MAERPLTEEEIHEIALRQDLVGFPKLALMRERLSAKAKSEPRFAFFNLYRHVVREDTIRCAWRQVKANSGGSGVDGVTIEDIERSEGGVEGFLKGIVGELHAKTYRASPVRRTYIEKANGKLRPLGIPTVKDRVVQTAVKLVVEPIFEADFHDCSYGFRPKRCAQQAVARIAEKIRAGEREVYDADLSSYFDTIPHDKLMLALRKRITDGSVLGLIRQWLKANIQEASGVRIRTKGKGTPQGGVISPLLSNVYLHWFETCAAIVAKATSQAMSVVRYADDFIILGKRLKEDFLARIEAELEGRFGLTVNREKTRVVDMGVCNASLTFLGYEFRRVKDRHFGTGGTYIETCPAMKSVKKVCKKVKEITSRRMKSVPIADVVKKVNLVIDGWGRYYRYGYPSRMFAKVNWYVNRRLYSFLRRRSQRKYRLRYAATYSGELRHYGLIQLTRGRYRQ